MGNAKNKRRTKQRQAPRLIIVPDDPSDSETEDDETALAIVTPTADDAIIDTLPAIVDESDLVTLSSLLCYFDAIRQIFSSNSIKLQKTWLLVDNVVDAIKLLSQMPKTGVSATGSYERDDFCAALEHGLGGRSMIGDQFDIADDETEKSYFVASLRTSGSNNSSRLTYFVYVDLSTSPKTVEQLKSKHWALHKPIQRADFLPVDVLEMTNFWYSTDAANLFCPLEDETAYEAAVNQQALLATAANDDAALRLLIDGLGPDDELPLHSATEMPIVLPSEKVEKLLKHKKFLSIFMARALALAVTATGNEPFHWQNICGKAVQELNDVGLMTYTSGTGKAIRDWFVEFRQRRKFPNPLLEVDRYGPPILLAHPGTVTRLKAKGDDNLAKLTCDYMHDWVHRTELPRMVKEYNDAMPTADDYLSVEEYLGQYHLSKVCRSTIHNWLLYCGFDHHEHKKGFYCDVHDRPDSVVDRIGYSLYHLTELDFLMRVWVRLPLHRVVELQSEGRIMKDFFGFSFDGADGEEMHEFHVDDIETSYTLPELQHTSRGGFLSIRMPEGSREHEEWGHDEVVGHEKALRAKCWHGSNGKVPLRPKDLGTSRHLSAFTSRQFGWNPVISEAQLEEINKRREGSKYLAEEQAVKFYGSPLKPKLGMEEQAFYWSMRPGANDDGYWNLSQFVMQLENFMDVCDVLYPDIQHVLSLDHSNNHGGKRVGGLDLNMLNGGHGGKQPIFDDNVLMHLSCLGKHDKMRGDQLELGDTQHYSFTGQSGPYWMSAQMQETTKYDVDTGIEATRKLTKLELVEAIRASPTPPAGDLEKRTSASLKAIAERLGIALLVTNRKIKEGWLGKPKGLLQLCWERRLIEADAPKTQYNKAHLKLLLGNCHDFKTELTLVEWVATKRGYKVIFSPKAHPEIAGVGIEYVWACCKNWLTMIPLGDRKGRDKFDKVFKECFGRTKLKDVTLRGCARAARQYMQAYILAHSEQLPDDKKGCFLKDELVKCVNPIPLAKINRKMKSYKAHRSVADINRGQVRIIMEEAIAAESS